MEPKLVPATFAEIEPAVRGHLATFQSPTDSFYEDHVLESKHYRIMVDGVVAGFASIHERMLITQFALKPKFRHLGQQAFIQLRRTESVRSSLVPTSDEFYLTHALDEYRSMARQAYFFTLANDRVLPIPSGFQLRAATLDDTDTIRSETDDFFEPVEASIAKGNVFLAFRYDELVGFGIMEISTLREATASIGMYTVKSCRGQGVATGTIALMIEECRQRGLQPIAGCWYSNHASKRTLERSGMYSPTRLMRFEY